MKITEKVKQLLKNNKDLINASDYSSIYILAVSIDFDKTEFEQLDNVFATCGFDYEMGKNYAALTVIKTTLHMYRSMSQEQGISLDHFLHSKSDVLYDMGYSNTEIKELLDLNMFSLGIKSVKDGFYYFK